MVQTAVEENMEKGFPGLIADVGPKTVDSFVHRMAQYFEATVTLDATDTTLTVNGTAYTELAAVGTASQIATALAVDLNAGEPGTFIAVGAVVKCLFDDPETVATVVGTANATVSEVVGAEEDIPFGLMVVAVPGNEKAAMLPISSDQLVVAEGWPEESGAPNSMLGVTLNEFTVEAPTVGGDHIGYLFNKSMSIMRRGRVFVQVEDAILAGGNVFVRFTAGAGGTQLGAFRSDADTATATLIKGLKYRKGADAGGLAVVDIDILHGE